MGLSSAGPGYGFRAHEHAVVAEQFVDQLGLDRITVTLHDWGGPIGLAVAIRHPERYRSRIVDRAGHFLQDDAPDEVCAEIRAWWPAQT